MTRGRAQLPSASAALSGIRTGVQAAGPWQGRLQLFVRFASESETATIFTAEALRSEIARLAGRSTYHSVAIGGHDALGGSEFLQAAFGEKLALPVMMDHDGQRPEQLQKLIGGLTLVQVTLAGAEDDGAVARVCESLKCAADKHVAHALVIIPDGTVSDETLLRIVDQTHQASGETAVVVHPSTESASERDRRWVVWLERATALHSDVRLGLRLPAPTGMH
ncbi:MAG: hypothetical protein H0W68_12530 [Gemmatimonadaceae bacterium]|nr:hypothetical protein [Gemmatimonadaceae bacterium]